MKKIFALLALLCSFISFSQYITVDTSTYTPFQLVNNVLINSPCANVNPTVISSTGTNFGSTNGIGYFENTNPAFPLTRGVILTTGNVSNAPGPNSTILSDGTVAWPGDTQLETALGAAGITMNSRNASFLQFQFTSISSNFNFQFLFASEEYGNFQCQSPDGFAFLLTDSVTGVTQNIAVIPSTTIPISVQTIRDNLYNSSCPSANQSYFGRFNGGSNATSSATNFEGQTILMNATATLVPNRVYTLKLVIADGNDNQYDSAIFIGGSSFDFTQDVLGPDLTLANGTALCNNNGINQSYTITSGLDPAIYTFVWKDNLGNPIPGETGPNLTINSPGTYQLTYYINGCEIETNDIVVEYNSSITTPNPVDLYLCNNGSPSYTFDLTFNNSIVNTNGNYTLSYYDNSTDANSGSSPIPTPASYTTSSASLPKQIWVRIATNTGCFVVKSFFLRLTPSPILNNPGNQTSCETSPGSGLAAFDLASLTNLVLGAQSGSIYNVSYHSPASGALTDTGTIDTTLPLVSGNTTIGIRIENITDPTCFSTANIDLIVKPRPILDNIPDQYVCIEYILPTLTNPGTYYTGPNQTGSILTPGTHITTNQTIYIYNNSGGSPSCSNERSFTVTIVGTNEITPPNLEGCDSVNVPNYILPSGIKYYLDNAHTQEITPGTPITTLGITTIYVVFTFADPACLPISNDFKITIYKTPTLSNTLTDLFDCTQIASLPVLNTDIGTANYYTFDGTNYIPLTLPITTTTTIYAYADNAGKCYSAPKQFTAYINTLDIKNVDLCSGTYTLQAPALGEFRTQPNGGGSLINTPIDYTSNQTIYHYIPGASCTNDDFFTITFHKPTLNPQNEIIRCGSYNLTANPDGGRYFTLQGGPANPSNTELFVGNSITTSTIIYIYKEATNPNAPAGCYNEIPWTITINPLPAVDSRGDILECYAYTLSPLANGTYYDNAYDPNNPSAHQPLLDNNNLPITDNVINVESDLNAGDDIPNKTKIIYIANINPNDPFCYSESSFKIQFDALPAFNQPNVYECNTYTLPQLTDPNSFYYNVPLDDTNPLTPHPGTPIAEGTVYNFSGASNPMTIGPIYIYTSTNNRKPCEDEKSFTITLYQTPVITPAIPTINDNIYACNDYTLPVLTVGKYYTLPGGPNTPNNVEIAAGTNYTSTQPAIYAYAEVGSSATKICSVEQKIIVNIYNVTELPDVPAICREYQLDTRALKPGENYYLPGGVTPLPNGYLVNTPGLNTIEIRGNAPSNYSPACSDVSDFTVTIIPSPVANTATIAPVCDDFNDITDGIDQFDLRQVETAVLGTQIPASDFTFSYFTTLADAANPNAIPIDPNTLSTYQNRIPFNDSVWVRISNKTTSNPCFDYTQIRLTVYKTPNPSLFEEYFICKDHEKGTILNAATLDCGVVGSNMTYTWTKDGAPYTTTPTNTRIITTSEPGIYEVTVTDNSTTNNCSNKASTKVTLYEPYITVQYSDAFENPSYIIVTVNGAGSGDYDYSIDGGHYQESNTFYNVTPGEHTISVRDRLDRCSPAPLKVVIINYPKYFTPNGDGYHETWNITDLIPTNPNVPILIYDRMGKLIKQITPATPGWNGTFNGEPLPSTDYWFTVEFDDKGNQRIFKAHFSLKR